MMIDKPREVKRIIIFDIMGKEMQIARHTAISNVMSMGASLKAGSYIVRVEAATWVKTFKVLKTNYIQVILTI